MTSSPYRAMFWLHIVFALTLAALSLPLASVGVAAQEAVSPGATALIANAGGQPVVLRENLGYEAAVLAAYPEGTPAEVLDGPLYAADGSAWYGVAIGDVTGYMAADFLTGSGASAAEPVTLLQEIATETEPLSADAGAPVATDDLNLRAGPSYDDAVLLVIPAGTALSTTGEWAEGFAGVIVEGQAGWVDGGYLGDAVDAPTEDVTLAQEAAPDAAAAPVASDLIGDLSAAPGGDPAYASDVLNLRAGPSYDDPVLRVLPVGGTLTVTGAAAEGWTPVWYNGTWGFVRDEYLAADAPLAAEPEPTLDLAQAAVSDESSGGATTLATAQDDLNLRAGPETEASLLGAIPAGTTLTPLAGPEQGYYQVSFGDQIGWVLGEALEISATYLQRGERDTGKIRPGDGDADAAEPGSGGISWPVSGGLWYLLQGYAGSSHQNESDLWQYYYSFDLARQDGDTAGQQVISPVNGTVRWTDSATGGISIDIGDGHAVAMFHTTFLDGLQPGTHVRQGQYLGTISGPGGPGFREVAHLHLSLWATNDGGNWDRRAEPFTGAYAISGMDFPDIGGSQQYEGTTFRP